MKILFIHPNMPGQYKHLCRKFAENPDNTVVFITKPRPHINIPNVHKIEYVPPREPSAETHHYLHSFERGIINGQEVYRICKKLKNEENFTPDVIVVHPGWGDALFLKDIYPNTPIFGFFEFYYNALGGDVNFDPNDMLDEDGYGRIRIKNSINLFNLEIADWGIVPTYWQAKQNPKEFMNKFSIIHDGIDTNVCRPKSGTTITLPNGTQLSEKDEVITYFARNFEPYRGFPTFMQAAEIILKNRPNAHIVAVGADDVSYGKRPPAGTTYRKIWLDKINVDNNRLHFIGYLPYDKLLNVMQISQAHIYLTFPFVLSWSMLESMSCGALVIGSSTQPVQEVIEDGKNGLLTDFFDPEALAKRVDEVFEHPDRMQAIRVAARETVVKRYSYEKLMPLHIGLVEDLAKGQNPPQTAQKVDEYNQQTGLTDIWKGM